MAKRPLENLVLRGWGWAPSSMTFTFSKGNRYGSEREAVFTDPNGNRYNDAEARAIHAWLGQLIVDLDHGV